MIKLAPRGAEAAGAALGFFEICDFLPRRTHHRGQHGLGDAHTARDLKRCVAGVENNHTHFAAVIFVDGAGGVGQSAIALD